MSNRAKTQVALSVLALALACSGTDNPPAAGDNPRAGEAGSGASPSGSAGDDSVDGGASSAMAGAAAGGAESGADAGEANGGAQATSGGAGSGGDDSGGSAGDEAIELGPEQCFDARDNDGNGATDCADSVCEQACSSSCTNTTELADPDEVTGNTRDHAAQLGSACKDPDGESGSEVVYDFVAKQSGMLELTLATVAPGLTLSIREVCGDDASELACATTNWLSVPVTAGDQLLIVVDGYTAASAGKYEISAATRPIKCGDGIRDSSEGCDDGDEAPGDGCSSDCKVESSEQNPNDELGEADPFDPAEHDYYYGELSEPGDVDWVSVEVPGPSSTLEARTVDYGDGACGLELLDSEIAIHGPDEQLLVENDDDPMGEGLCAVATATGLAAGTYYVRVAATPADPELTFPYALELSIH